MFDQVDQSATVTQRLATHFCSQPQRDPHLYPSFFLGSGEAMPFTECLTLAAFEARLTAMVGADAVRDFYADVCQRLAAARLLHAAGFSGASASPGAAQGRTGFVKAKCHEVGHAVSWAQADFSAFPAGSGYGSFSMRNADLFEQLVFCRPPTQLGGADTDF